MSESHCEFPRAGSYARLENAQRTTVNVPAAERSGLRRANHNKHVWRRIVLLTADDLGMAATCLTLQEQIGRMARTLHAGRHR